MTMQRYPEVPGPRADASSGRFDETPHGGEGRLARARSELTGLGAAWLYGVVAISLLLILTTAASAFFDGADLIGYVLRKLDLRLEHNPAASWSAMLLALTSAHAFDGYACERLRDPGLARGWLLIALVLLALSADELGSLHERAGMLGFGDWGALLPFALVLAGMTAYGLMLLWRTQANRRKVAHLALGFFLMGTVALQEFVEHRIELTTAAAKALRAALEEGAEICGMLIVLQVVMRNTAGLSVGRGGGDTAFDALRDLRLPLASVALVLAPFIAYLTSALPDHLHHGRPSDWAVAILLFAAAAAACGPYLATGGRIGWDRLLFCGLCGLAAVSVVDGNPERVLALGPVVANAGLLVLGSLGLLAWGIWSLDPQVYSRRLYAVGGIVLAVLASASLLPLDPFAVYLLSQLIALTVYLVCSAPQAPTGSRA